MDASNPANTPSETYAIAPTGDTILVVGDGKTQLRVHSVCMRTASKVFDAMFGPHFSEGQPSNGNLPKEIHLPHDDATAMTTICKAIHYRNDLVPDVLEPEELPEITVTADKYDCVLVLKYVMKQWLVFTEPVVFLELGNLMVAAYISNNPYAFRQITQKLIIGTFESYHSLVNVKHGETIPLFIYCKCIPINGKLLLFLNMLPDSLERARNRIRVDVQDALHTDMSHCRDHTIKGAYGHMQVLLKNDLWGSSPFRMSIDSAIEKARNMVPPVHCQYCHEEQRFSILEELRETAGLCLSCVHSGNIDASLPCKLDH